MQQQNLNLFLDSLNWRYATKLFDSTKKLTEDNIDQLTQALQLAPSSFGLQPWKFFIVKDEKIKAELKAHAWNQPQITDCSHLFVLASKTTIEVSDIETFSNSIASIRGVEREKVEGYHQMMLSALPMMQGDNAANWLSNQVYIALGVILSACAISEIDACPMEGFDRSAFDKILKLPEKGYNAKVLCAVGYRSSEDKYASLKKVRYSVNDVVEKI